MIRRLSKADELAAAERLRDAVASGETTIAVDWLTRSGALVIAQESGRHLEPEEAPLVAHAFAAAGVKTLLAIVNDSLAVRPEAYELAVSTDDLTQVCDDLVGVNFVLVDPGAGQCILFTAYDFKLIAGSSAFITSVAGEPQSARDSFLQFAQDQPDGLRATADRAAEYMKWIADPE